MGAFNLNPSIKMTCIVMNWIHLSLGLLSFLIILPQAMQAQTDSTLNKRTYQAWVKRYDQKRLTEGILYGVQDSAIRLLNPVPMMFRDRAQTFLTIPVSSTEEIKLRRKGSKGMGMLIGGLIGASLGALVSVSVASHNPKSTGVYVYPVMCTGLGVGLGVMFGSIKIRIPIYGNRDNFNFYRERLNGYAKIRNFIRQD
jgi:hypothetical protein